MTKKVTCSRCGVSILATTADENGGQCMPCATGTREAIDEGKAYAAAQRSRGHDPFWQTWTDICEKKRVRGFSTLKMTEQEFFAMNFLRGAVLRGGFHPYFDMAAKDEIETAKRAFRESGTPEISAIVEQAERILFPAGLPSDLEAQIQQLPCWTEQEIQDDSEPEWSVDLEAVNHSFYEVASRADAAVQRFFDRHFPKDA